MKKGQSYFELILLGIAFFFLALVALSPLFEVKTYNKIYHTNYTMTDFMFARQIILDYQGQGKIQTYKLNLNNESNNL